MTWPAISTFFWENRSIAIPATGATTTDMANVAKTPAPTQAFESVSSNNTNGTAVACMNDPAFETAAPVTKIARERLSVIKAGCRPRRRRRRQSRVWCVRAR